MPIMLRNTPAPVTLAIFVAIAANIAAAVVMFMGGVELGGALATVLALATYVYVYTTIAGEARPFAKSSAGYLAFFNVLLVISSITSHQQPIISGLALVAAACTGYIYMTLKVPVAEKPAAAAPVPAAAPVATTPKADSTPIAASAMPESATTTESGAPTPAPARAKSKSTTSRRNATKPPASESPLPDDGLPE